MLPWGTVALVLILAVPTVLVETGGLYPVTGDARVYHEVGKDIAELLQTPSALGRAFTGELTEEDHRTYGLTNWVFQQVPTYAFTLGGAYALFGNHSRTGRLVSAVLFALAGGLLVLWTCRHFGPLPAGITGVLFALWPPNLNYGTAVMTELPVLFFLLAALVALEGTRNRGTFGIVLGGVVLGVASYAKITLLYLPALLLLVDALLSGARTWGNRVRFLGLRLLGVATVAVLWHGFLGLANVTYFPYEHEGMSEMWLYRGGYVPDRGFETVGQGEVITPAMVQARMKNPGATQAQGFRDSFLNVLREYPLGWVALVCAKMGWFFRIPAIGGDMPLWFASLPPPWNLQLVCVLLAIAGVLVVIRHRPQALFVLVPVAWMAVGHAATHLVPRYGLPSQSLLFPFAALGAVFLLGALARSKSWNLSPLWDDTGSLILSSLWIGLVAAYVVVPGEARMGSLLSCDVKTWILCLALLLLAILVYRHGAWPSHLWRRALSVAVFPLLPMLAVWGHTASDPDRDVFRAELSQTGDAVTQAIRLPENIDWRTDKLLEVAIDMMPSLDFDGDIAVYVNGTKVKAYEGKLENPREGFAFSRPIFGPRADVLERELERHLEGFVNRRYPDIGLGYFPQWYRVLITPDLLNQNPLILEVHAESVRRGHVAVFGDLEVHRTRSGKTGLTMPGFLVNAYEASHYQFRMFQLDREEADPRLSMPYVLDSQPAGSGFIRNGVRSSQDLSPSPGVQTGLYRMRLRVKSIGVLALETVTEADGSVQRRFAYTRNPGPTKVELSLEQKREAFRARDRIGITGWTTW